MNDAQRSPSPARSPGVLNAAPPITPGLAAAARANPGQQISVIDPEFDPDGAVPGWGVRGYFPVSNQGEIQEQAWVPNPGYRPGPFNSGFSRPRNWLERHLQLAATGYEPGSALLSALVAAEVAIPTLAEHPDQIPVLTDDEGHNVVVLFTRADLIPAGTPSVTVPATVLGPMVANAIIRINPGLRPSAELPGHDLTAALATIPPSTTRP